MNTVSAIIDALRRAPDIVLPLVREVPSGILKRRPAPRRWSAHEHACHLAHVHALFFDRLEYMLAGEMRIYGRRRRAPLFDSLAAELLALGRP
jgi:hypothetical protein